jgi:hypothetical protein
LRVDAIVVDMRDACCDAHVRFVDGDSLATE